MRDSGSVNFFFLRFGVWHGLVWVRPFGLGSCRFLALLGSLTLPFCPFRLDVGRLCNGSFLGLLLERGLRSTYLSQSALPTQKLRGKLVTALAFAVFGVLFGVCSLGFGE